MITFVEKSFHKLQSKLSTHLNSMYDCTNLERNMDTEEQLFAMGSGGDYTRKRPGTSQGGPRAKRAKTSITRRPINKKGLLIQADQVISRNAGGLYLFELCTVSELIQHKYIINTDNFNMQKHIDGCNDTDIVYRFGRGNLIERYENALVKEYPIKPPMLRRFQEIGSKWNAICTEDEMKIFCDSEEDIRCVDTGHRKYLIIVPNDRKIYKKIISKMEEIYELYRRGGADRIRYLQKEIYDKKYLPKSQQN